MPQSSVNKTIDNNVYMIRHTWKIVEERVAYELASLKTTA